MDLHPSDVALDTEEESVMASSEDQREEELQVMQQGSLNISILRYISPIHDMR